MKRGVFQPNKTRDITGQKFGSLTAVRFDHRDEKCKEEVDNVEDKPAP